MTVILKDNGLRQLPFDEPRLLAFIKSASRRYPNIKGIEEYTDKILRTVKGKESYKADQITNTLLLNALDRIGTGTGQDPNWTYIASYIHLRKLYKEASKNRCYDASLKYGDFYSLIKTLATEGIYDPALLREYAKEEINEIGKMIDKEKDHLFTYIGLRTLSDRYLATDKEKRVFELPQERWLIIAMSLMINEPKEHRMMLIRESYWAMSNLYMTNATPTMANAGKTYGQLSSCFIDYMDDSLNSINFTNYDVARLSKGAGGIGIFAGSIRARGSDIKGFKGISKGVVPWVKQLNNTAISVDQLGQRKGSIAVYLQSWHKDIFYFLDGRLVNGDERLKFLDIFTGLVAEDLFMEAVENRSDWYLFDPHEIEKEYGWRLEDFYDEEKGKGSFRTRYQMCVDNPNISKERVKAIDIMKAVMKSQLESGTPYMFYVDEVNRQNPNKHKGKIYCSNLCSEIMQNLSPTAIQEEVLTDDGRIILVREAGDFVVCNLNSTNFGTALLSAEGDILPRLIKIQVRMLDNVIDLNEDKIEVKQAVMTNRRYRAIGLGTYGLAEVLAVKKIKWESDEAVQFNDEIYERVAFLTIKASMELSKEKGSYPYFEGSEWQTGEYFSRRDYVSEEWRQLAEDVATYGVRNGYMMATAPTGSTSIIGGSTAGIDPIFKREYSEEKKDYKIPVCVPSLSAETWFFYKSAYDIDQLWSIKQNAARQRHIDQGISFNLYVLNNVKASTLLNLHIEAWKQGLKSTYYVRSTSIEIAECESCSG